jgi:dynein heavy chain
MANLDTYKEETGGLVKRSFAKFNLSKYFQEKGAETLIFCHFAGGLVEKCYDQVLTMESLYTTLREALNEYNEINTEMDLELFEDAMKHVCRISRIIANPSGHALLVGVGGSGKQSLSRLSAYICNY